MSKAHSDLVSAYKTLLQVYKRDSTLKTTLPLAIQQLAKVDATNIENIISPLLYIIEEKKLNNSTTNPLISGLIYCISTKFLVSKQLVEIIKCFEILLKQIKVLQQKLKILQSVWQIASLYQKELKGDVIAKLISFVLIFHHQSDPNLRNTAEATLQQLISFMFDSVFDTMKNKENEKSNEKNENKKSQTTTKTENKKQQSQSQTKHRKRVFKSQIFY